MFRIVHEYKILIHLDIYLGLELLDHGVNVSVITKKKKPNGKKKPARLFTEVAITFYLPMSSECLLRSFR